MKLLARHPDWLAALFTLVSVAGFIVMTVTPSVALATPPPPQGEKVEVYQDGQRILAHVRPVPTNAAQELLRQGDGLPDFYDGRIWTCEVSPTDPSVIVCFEGWNPPVLGDVTNPPFYRGVEIFFMPGAGPYVFTSVSEIAAAEQRGEIQLHRTEDVFLCKLAGRSSSGNRRR